MKSFTRRLGALFLVFLIISPIPSPAYSVLTHEAIVDVVWDANLRPLLLKRFPNATPDELIQAHAYAYGGSIIQDMGYYPSGNKLFSDLTHYFRSGDFILALLRNASTLNEYAFALGSIAHYAADNEGHPLATNVVVPLLYPELQKKYGSYITYEDNPLAHIKTEFGFDVLQVAKGHYASENYHNFIGFEVALPLVEKAFLETYGIDLKTISKDDVRAANSYRYSISTLIPKATRVAWNLKQDDIQRDLPGTTRNKFLYNIHRSSYRKQWGKDYVRPNLSDKILAFIIRILPKIGPLKILTFRTPTPEAEKLFENSFNQAVDLYRHLLTEYDHGDLQLPNDNFDIGAFTYRGQYTLNDRACADLLHRLSQQHGNGIDPDLRAQLLAFYATKVSSFHPKKHDKAALQIDQEVKALQDLPVNSVQAAP